MSYLVYVAEPMDQSPNRIQHTWRAPEDWTLYRPSQAFAGPFGPNLDDCNRAVMTTIDGLLAFLPVGVPTIGVPAEIEHALSHGIPTAIVTDIDRSVAIQGFAARGAYVTDSAADAVKVLNEDLRHAPNKGEIGFVRTGANAELPRRGFSDDVGLDLFASEPMRVPVMQFRDVPAGVICNLPPGMWGYITSRSSTMRKHRLWVTPGVIDPSFRGELFVGIWNVGGATHDVRVGDRLGQLILMPAITPVPVWDVDVTPGITARGALGFGSTGA
jgi:dUTP pyrophosphatase